jgi:hypothetical protein
VARDGFFTLAPMFTREHTLAQKVTQDPLRWWSAHRRLRAEIRLLRPDGHDVPEFLLHIAGDHASWRYPEAPCESPSGHAERDFERRIWNALGHASNRVPARLRSVAVALVTAAGFAIAPAIAFARGQIHHRTSDNWAGYAVTAKAPFRSVSGRWLQPAAKCEQGSATYSAFWVGLGGFKRGSRKLEQIGTEADCTTAGHTKTYAWYELVPNAPVQLRLRLSVHPGDRLAGGVTIHGDRVRLRLDNLTTHRHFSKTVSFPAPDRSSAEWIAEAPSVCNGTDQCQPLPLSDFGTVQFTNSTVATVHGHPSTITAPAFTVTKLTLSGIAPGGGPPPPVGPPAAGPQPVTFTPVSDTATPSPLSGSGTAFDVTFKHGKTPPPPAAPLASPEQLRHAPSTAPRFDP